jgi:type I restriction enzyme S subunit
MCTNQGFKSLIPSSQLHNWFLFFTLKHYVSALKSMGRGQTFTEVSKKQIENFKIPLPSLAVQLRVALDIKEKNTYIKELCANVEKQLEAINMLSQVIIAGAFKGGL